MGNIQVKAAYASETTRRDYDLYVNNDCSLCIATAMKRVYAYALVTPYTILRGSCKFSQITPEPIASEICCKEAAATEVTVVFYSYMPVTGNLDSNECYVPSRYLLWFVLAMRTSNNNIIKQEP